MGPVNSELALSTGFGAAAAVVGDQLVRMASHNANISGSNLITAVAGAAIGTAVKCLIAMGVRNRTATSPLEKSARDNLLRPKNIVIPMVTSVVAVAILAFVRRG